MAIMEDYLAYKLKRDTITEAHGLRASNQSRGPRVKRGIEILDGPYPQAFADFIGQSMARTQILAAITTAVVMKESMGHMLLASGMPGVGKTALARLTAFKLGAGMVELSGLVTDKDACAAIKVMKDGDVLLLDEVHRLVSHGKAKAEWLLTLLQDGELHMPTGVVIAPKITVIAATTDKEKLPQTILDRFQVQPILENYTTAEGLLIAQMQAKRLGYGSELLPMPEATDWLAGVARAARNNPRRISQLLSSVRDVALSNPGSMTSQGYDIATALEWNGLTPDGITRIGQDYMMGLLAYGGTAGVATIKALLNEADLTHTERDLIQSGCLEITSQGRTLTDYGSDRAIELVETRMKGIAS